MLDRESSQEQGVRLETEFEKRLEELGVAALTAFVVLRSTEEELARMYEEIADVRELLVHGTEMAQELAELMEAAHLRYASALLNRSDARHATEEAQ